MNASTPRPDAGRPAHQPVPAEADVVVIGFGIAGGCAAVEAASAGASVLVMERAAVAGGTSAMAGGHFYLGGGTAVQRATGHKDSPDEMHAYLMAVTPEPEADKVRAYADGSVEHCDWLEGLGFAFERSYYPEKAVIQPQTRSRYLATPAGRSWWWTCSPGEPPSSQSRFDSKRAPRSWSPTAAG
jgi:succinate dehydrogenase/fumarate reductase flavoprotein subunit